MNANTLQEFIAMTLPDFLTQDKEGYIASTEIPADIEADTQAVIARVLMGKPLAPEVYRRIRARAERVTQEIRRKHGVLNIGVPAIRELRGELPA
jgi:hypothetical protein